ncbi:hypothetical protein SISNIDRAFT_483526 [Sistotremastrum niveocremeum HHB9708]|uniref:Mitochondrial import inner membrane translocase subunit Tim21 n=1 Tax=Sistotremastrum niveocremeum HHB9708 TaxID=1314777 RepID=A0A164XMY5_9AGAM|nr:hypothetical protein SISNIDRAFT_483526 [Sistotremastrum niveocremeum HHB9708]
MSRLPGTLLCSVQCARASYIRLPKHVRLLEVRAFATHRDIPATSPILSQHFEGRSNTGGGSVGPFQLGISQDSRQENVKKWRDLSPGGKVLRTTARTTNLGVILLGAGLSAVLVYALATELFAKNSPTVLYGQACERIKASAEVQKYLRGPLSFHNNAPSFGRPRHRNRHVSSQLAVDSQGREHMLLNFFVSCDPERAEEANVDSDEPIWSRVGHWCRTQTANVRDTSWREAKEWTKTKTNDALDYSKRIFLLLTGQPLPRPVTHSGTKPRETEIGRSSEGQETSTAWSFAGLFSGLKGKTRAGRRDAVEEAVRWTEGEVHADLVRDASGDFVWRYLLVDIPNSRTRNPIRVFVERSAGVREGEAVMMWA